MMIAMGTIYDEIRIAIQKSEKSRYRLWKETGISEAQLCQFMGGTKGLSVESLEKLAESLDLEITARPRSRQRKSGRKGR
jgi:DNA-binding Xre family transcriptional regulator